MTSIIIRCYNEEQHIGRLLIGIMQQTVKDIEIIPYLDTLLNKDTLFESYDVFHRFYLTNNSSKQYIPSASLLVVIKDV